MYLRISRVSAVDKHVGGIKKILSKFLATFVFDVLKKMVSGILNTQFSTLKILTVLLIKKDRKMLRGFDRNPRQFRREKARLVFMRIRARVHAIGTIPQVGMQSGLQNRSCPNTDTPHRRLPGRCKMPATHYS